MVGEITKIPIGKLIMLFVVYLLIHLGIAWYYKKLIKNQIDNPNNEEVKSELKTVKIIFQWFPAAYVILLLLIFYSM